MSLYSQEQLCWKHRPYAEVRAHLSSINELSFSLHPYLDPSRPNVNGVAEDGTDPLLSLEVQKPKTPPTVFGSMTSNPAFMGMDQVSLTSFFRLPTVQIYPDFSLCISLKQNLYVSLNLSTCNVRECKCAFPHAPQNVVQNLYTFVESQN